MKNLNKKAARALAVSMFAVGFVTPLIFGNIAEATNFGKGGTAQWLSNDVLDKTSTSSTTQTTSQWATQTGTDIANYVMLDGYKFKIVAVEGTGSTAKVTLWSYDKETHGTETGFGTAKYVSSGDPWGTAEVQADINKAYAAGDLAATVDGLISKFSSETQGRIQTVTLADETNIKSLGYGCDYKTANGSADLTAKVWLPSWTEVKGNTGNTTPGTEPAGTWGLTSDDQRAIGPQSLLRSPRPDDEYTAYLVGSSGDIETCGVFLDFLLRPALQILNQTSHVFTTNVTIPTNGVFTADSSGSSPVNCTLNDDSTAGFIPGFTPTSGVTLDGTKIGITTTDSTDADYKTTGLLTTNSGTTWDAINTGDNANIAYMAQVNSGKLDLQNVAAGTDYTLKVFGLKTADTTVTELASGAITGLSKGSDGKIHMKIGGTYNNGVPVTLTNGAFADLAGTANNNITVTGTGENGGCLGGEGTLTGTVSGAGDLVIGNGKDTAIVATTVGKLGNSGTLSVATNGTLELTDGNLAKAVTNNGTVKLNGATLGGAHVTTGTLEFAKDLTTNANYVAANTNKVDSGVTLTLTDGALGGNLSGAGAVVIDGTVTSDKSIANALTINADKSLDSTGTITGAVTNNGILTVGAGNLQGAVTNNGTINLGAGILADGKTIAGGTLNINGDVTSAANYIAGATNTIAENKTLTLTDGALDSALSGLGKVVIDGTVSADADKFTQTGGLEVKDTLAFTSGGLNVAAVGGFTQAADSEVVVPVSAIESDTNDAAKALFIGVNDAEKLNVGAGNLTVKGMVQDGKYYVLVAGTAVNSGTVSDATLWKMENISFPDILMADYEIKYDVNILGNPGSVALKVNNAVTKEEGNTSGLAAVQQGNITIAKEFTGEVENYLGFMNKPSLKGKKATVCNVAGTAEDKHNIETVEQGKASEVMPVQVAEEGTYKKEVWASYIRTKETTEGMKLGEGMECNNTAQYNGAVVGVDFYTSKKAIAGVAFSYTTGDIDSYSGTTFTRNKSKYYGVSFYDRATNDNTALIYDIGYVRGDNDISQFYTGKEITADIKTDTYTAGVRYEAEFGTEKSRVVPFASFRYMRQNNKGFTNSHNTRFETKNQNLYIPKVGIAWTGEFVMPKSVWTWRPHAEAGYVWNLGDRSVDGNVFMGANVEGIEYDTVDKSSYYAKAGMEFINKNFNAGLFYRYLKGDKVRNNKWNVNVSWKF